ncbi:MAG: M12 family metallo-peptidase, partial [Xanthobacteraceae bacterium]
MGIVVLVKRSLCRFAFLLSLAFSLTFAVVAAAQGQNVLFQPLADNQIASASPEQSRAIATLRAKPTTASLQLVRINTDALRGNNTMMAFGGGANVQVNRRDLITRSAQDFTWVGTLPASAGDATLVVHNGNVTGTVRIGTDLYRITPVGSGIHAVIKVDQRRFPPEHPPSFQERERRGDARPPGAARGAAVPVEITVLVGYTPSALLAEPNMAALIQLAVDETNQSYLNSNINITLSLVGTLEVMNYSEAGKSFDRIMWDLFGGSTPGMAEVHRQRDLLAADLVAVIVNNPTYCGLADAIMATAATAYALVYYDCATGYYSFGHELGHLQGARHNPANDPTSLPFPYGHGYQHPPWRTIMAYNCPGSCTRLQYWSNPDILYAGVPMGTAALSNNARVLNETASTVAAFRPLPAAHAAYCRFVGNSPNIYFSCGTASASKFGDYDINSGPWSQGGLDPGYADSPRFLVDVNADGKPDYCRFVGNAPNIFLSCALQTSDIFGQYDVNSQPGFDAGYANMPRFMADVNGDGKADYCRFVGNAPNISLSCALSTGTTFGTYDVNSQQGFDAGYANMPRFMADVNGDGKADYCRFVGNA